MQFSIQPVLENDQVILSPLAEADLEPLYAVASDPKIWEQHPTKDRWQRPVYETFFEGALQSKGAFKIIDKQTGAIAGSTRFYDYNEEERSIMIGYTFYATRYWGKGINPGIKAMMLDYVFQYVDQVYFQIGAYNTRSQIAIGRIGAVKTGEQELSYHGEPSRLNFMYGISKQDWMARRAGVGS